VRSGPRWYEPIPDALVSLVPSDLDEAEPCPGSLLTQMSALASPDTFVWSRLTDAALSATHDVRRLELIAGCRPAPHLAAATHKMPAP